MDLQTPDHATLQLAREMCGTPERMITFLETRVRLYSRRNPAWILCAAAVSRLREILSPADTLQDLFEELHAAVDDREPDVDVVRRRLEAALALAVDDALGEWFVARCAEIGPASLAGACYGVIGSWFLQPEPGPRQNLQRLADGVQAILDCSRGCDAAALRNWVRAYLQLTVTP